MRDRERKIEKGRGGERQIEGERHREIEIARYREREPDRENYLARTMQALTKNKPSSEDAVVLNFS